MSQAEYLNHAIWGDLVDDQMPRVGDAIFSIDEVPRRPEMVSADTGDTRDVARSSMSRRYKTRPYQ
jgi:hypothetical protein